MKPVNMSRGFTAKFETKAITHGVKSFRGRDKAAKNIEKNEELDTQTSGGDVYNNILIANTSEIAQTRRFQKKAYVSYTLCTKIALNGIKTTGVVLGAC